MIEYYSMNSISRAIATLFYVGYIPFAPGTFGTFAGMLFIWLLRPSMLWQAFILAGVCIIGVIAAGIAEKSFGEKDSQYIVIDEFAGYLCSVIFLPLTPLIMLAAFVLFRFFDIIKPPPICRFEKIGGGSGIMLDDIAAGVITNVILQVCVVLL